MHLRTYALMHTCTCMTDIIHRPDNHQPQESGGHPAPHGARPSLYQVQAAPQRAFPDTRVNTLGSLLEGYGQPLPATPLAPGHDQDLFDPQHRAANLTGSAVVVNTTRNGRGGRAGQQQQQLGAPSGMLNGPNYCFAGAGLLVLLQGEVGHEDR